MRKSWRKLTALTAAVVIGVAAIPMMETPKKVNAAEMVMQSDEERASSFNEGWKFFLETEGSINASGKEYDDSSWRDVNLPHDYSIEQGFDRNSPGTANGGYINGGIGWYRKTFVLPEEMAGKRISIDFGGIYMDSTTYVNGKMVGNYPYGYSPFTYDITDFVTADGVTENVISIKVNHQQPSSRWYSGSGIYRNVDLVVTDPVHVARYGTYVTTPNLEDEYANNQAKVHVETKVENETEKDEQIKVRTTIVDDKGEVFQEAETTEEEQVDAGGITTFTQDITTGKPKLWDTENPNLYQVKTEVLSGEKVIDTYETTLGFRWITMDANEGFFLNGEYMKLHGMCMHHDQGALGSVVNYRAIERQMESLQEMGVNAIRVTHNPAADELLEICNKKGLLVIDEAFDCWESAKRSKDYARFFSKAATHPDAKPGQTWAEFDIKNMVDRGKNEPCIIMWSIGNEIVGASTNTASKLVKWVKEVDPTRPATQGFNNFIGGFYDNNMKKVADVTGVVGFNYGEKSYDAAHKEYPDWLIIGTETSSAVRSRGFYRIDDVKKIRSNYDDGKTVGWGLSAEDAWKADRDRKFVMGQFVWTGYDYIGEPSPYHDQWPAKSSYFGVFDTAGIPKDAFYIYQSQWVDVNEEPMVHLLPHWNWENDDSIKQNGKIKVQAYSNAASVELILNGESLGKKEFLQKKTADGRAYQEAEDGHIYLEWLVEYVPGKLEAIARDVDGKEIARDVVETTGEPAKVKLTPDRQVITSDGKDLSYITVDILDEEGRVVPTADNRVNFQISGNGKIVGVDNGDATEVEDSYQGNTRKAYSGKAMVIVQSTEKEGSFTLTASSGGLEGAKTVVFTTEETEEKKLAGYENFADITTDIGVQPTLPEKAAAIYNDGSKEEKNVIWNEIDEDKLQTAGMFTLNGVVEGTDDEVSVNIIVVGIIGIRDASVVTNVGTIPVLPETVSVIYNNGQEKQMSVVWNEVTEDMVSEEGVLSVEGTVEDVSEKAKANIHVVKGETTFTKDIAKRNGEYPKPAASFVQANGNDPVEAINNGKVYYGGGPAGERWIPWGHNEAQEWVSLEFKEEHRIGKVGIDFWTNPSDNKMDTADTITIEYSMDGTDWEAVENQSISTKDEFVTNAENVIEFTPVDAKFIRWKFYSEAKLAQGVSEVHVYEEETNLPISSEAFLEDLQLNGETLEGFNKEQYYYIVELAYGEELPTITAQASEYASMFIIPALDENGAVKISVVAEDGNTRLDYTIQFRHALPTLAEAKIMMEQTRITQDDIEEIKVDAKLEDGSSLGHDVFEVAYELSNPEIAKIKDNKLYAYYPGETTLKAVVTYQEKAVESNTLQISIKENTEVSEITGYEEVHVTTEKGVIPTLPDTIRATFKEGLPKKVAVTWNTISKEQCEEYGEFIVKGTVEGQKLQPAATILVKGVTGVQEFSAATPVGVVPQLPEKASLYYSDGTKNEASIQWEAHPQELFMEDGKIVTVKGTVTENGSDKTFETKSTIRVSKDSYKGDKFTGYKNGFYWPLGIASFTNRAGSSNDLASELNDNIVSRESGGNNRWTNWSSNWRASDWVGIIFGLEEVSYKFIDHLEVDFYIDYGAEVPKEIDIQYYTGEYFNTPPKDQNQVTAEHPAGVEENWKSVENLKLPETISAAETNVFTFDPVETCAIRMVMKAQDGKCLAVTEMASYEKLVTKQDKASLKNIIIDGAALSGFDSEQLSYTIEVEKMPVITAETSDNASATIITPDRFGGRAQIIVTAEDGVHTKTYEVTVNKKETVDKEDLKALIDYAKGQQEEVDYKYLVPAVKTLFEKALADAKTIWEKPNATQAEVDAAYDVLLAKVHLLDFTGNTQSLKVLVDAAQAKYQQEEMYTKESWEPFAKAFEAAKELLKDENALQAEIDAAHEALQAAMEALVLKPIDTKKLEKLIADSKQYEDNINKYTSDSAKAFTAALEGARAVLTGDKLTQEAVDSAYTTLRNAVFGLREIPNKDKLGELLGKVKAMDLSVYSEATASAVKAAYAKATAVFEDENADQKKVDAAVAALEEAVAAANAEAGDVTKEENTSKKEDDSAKGDKVASDNAGSKGTANKTAAKTGDSANAAIPMTAGLVAILAAVIVWRKKTNRV